MNSRFYDINSPVRGDIIEDKSEIDLEDDIPLCDNCENIILKPINNLDENNNTKLICPKCGQRYNPHYEIIQTQDQETTIDEISNKGQLTFKDDTPKPKKTINRQSHNLENLDYVKKEFDRYRQTEIIDNTKKQLRKNRGKIRA